MSNIDSTIVLSQSIQPEGVEKPLTIIGLGNFEIATTGLFTKTRDEALASASLITEVSSQSQLDEAIKTVATLKGVAKQVEKARTEVKAPVLALGKRIDESAKAFTKEVDSEVKRVEKLASSYVETERKKAEAAAEAQRQEQARQARIESGNEEESLAASLEEQVAPAAVAIPAVIPSAPVTTGASVKAKLVFEVTDIEAFYEWAKNNSPHLPLVKLEVNKANVNSLINFKGLAEASKIPGITVSEETKLSTRAALV